MLEYQVSRDLKFIKMYQDYTQPEIMKAICISWVQ